MADTTTMANNDHDTLNIQVANNMPSPQSNTLDEKADVVQQQKKRERAKGRWKILQKALLGHAAAATNQTPPSTGPHNNNDSSTDASTKNGVSSASIHRFPGFQILQRNTVAIQDDSNIKDIIMSNDNGGGRECHECVEYAVALLVPKDNTHPRKEEDKEEWLLKFRTRERIPQSRRCGEDGKMDLTSLISHRVHGVDNTGNAKVWNSESVLSHCLLRGKPPQSSHGSTAETVAMRNMILPFGLENVMNLGILNPEENEMNHPLPLRVVELGAGMAGLAGLSLAAANQQSSLVPTTTIHKRGVEVLLTDGHPDCVENNRISSLLTMSLHNTCTNHYHDSVVTFDDTTTTTMTILKSMRLLWKDNAQGAEECTDICAGTSGFHLCLASDCVHFQEFHAALAATIGRLLCVGGICILCQPPRGNSLQRFMALVHSMGSSSKEEKDQETEAATIPTPLFTMHEWDRYDVEITRQHDESLASSNSNDNGYDPNIHYPHMLLLRKEREYDERFTEDAVKHQQERGNDYI
eukprot:scaffold48361_cov49-Attheya_sp.AAC.3